MSLPAFAELLERLLFTPGRAGKLALLRGWFDSQPDPERGIGLAALSGELRLRTAKPALLREMAAARTDPTLFALSYDYVGDLAETIALLWPEPEGLTGPPPALSQVVGALEAASRADIPGLIAGWLDALDAGGRLALIKLVTGGLRVGASGRLARLALAEWAGVEVGAVEEVWHGVAPPYEPLFLWLEGRGPRPDPAGAPVFRPLMLAHPLEEREAAALDPAEWCAEWKWDGIRVQITGGPGGARLWSRAGEDISAAFPEIVAAARFHAVLDGELVVLRGAEVAPFSDLQQRLNRKSVTARLQRDFPVAVRLYDMLFDGAEDLRGLPFAARRARLEAWFARSRPARMDLSPLIPFESMQELARLRAQARAAAIEGLMLKRRDSPYLAGRVKGLWWKWKRDPLTLDCVLMYAQRGHGKRSSFYSDYTFGVWKEGELVPVGKAYSGYTDEELAWLDRWIREHTVARFGPVREVEKTLVLEVAFDAAQRSRRHKSGFALRFPRIARIRRDKPAAEADGVEAVAALAAESGAAPR
ncbi:cisplatin damage response ATP-dependent DNA ligase [Rubritepida flocculans]|uniref:cisplatin damage response ATP-dependent DNA ligase n=1 Tax=Rubritepida flocculans TaxID=182403 RepID=UPI00048081D4|nr:cisplatin damage response ATP-dependent DNA ligase [Rubritepida flocculans]